MYVLLLFVLFIKSSISHIYLSYHSRIHITYARASTHTHTRTHTHARAKLILH